MTAAAARAKRRAVDERRRSLRLVPYRRDGFVARPRLVQRLVEGAHAPLALIAAPAGYGKTTLLQDWARADRRPFAWLAIDESHDDPHRLMAAIESAVRDGEPVGRPGPGLASLVRSLQAWGPLVVVCDDVHKLHSADAIEVLRALVSHMPRGCQLALASRTEPALPIGRLRAHRVLTEVRARELAMTTGEAAELLAGAGLALPAAKVDRLVAQTEGWPAGLYLAALALRDQPDPCAAVAGFHGDDVVVADYIRDEVLAQLAPDAARFLIRTSVIDRLSGPACDAVLERGDSAQVLSELGRGNLLLVPLDRRGEAYRCHPLLGEMLTAELRRLEPGSESALHRRASDWCAARGDNERAINHAIAAGDVPRAASLLHACALDYVTHGRNARIQRWLSHFNGDQIASQPALALAAATSHFARGELDMVQRLAEAARSAAADTPELRAQLALMRAAVAADGLAGMDGDARSAYELEPEASPLRALGCLFSGVARHLSGDPDEAERVLEEGVRRAAVSAPSVQSLCLAQLALLAADRDEADEGMALVARARAQVNRYGLEDYPTSALVYAASAAVRSRGGRAEEAQEDIRRTVRLLARIHDFMPWYEVETRVALARALLRAGDVARSRELLAQASRIARRVPDAVVLRDWLAEVGEQASAASESAARGPLGLTTAELRILGFLPTHLSFREIAGHLHVSANTVKTQANSVYRKLDVSSRSQAVSRATECGLIDA